MRIQANQNPPTVAPYMVLINQPTTQTNNPYHQGMSPLVGDGHKIVAQRAYYSNDAKYSLIKKLSSNNILKIKKEPDMNNNDKKKIFEIDNSESISSNNNKGENNKNGSICFKNDYSNHYIHSDIIPVKFIRNAHEPVDGYPKLQRLHKLKEEQIKKHSLGIYGVRISSDKIISTLNKWIYEDFLTFDVIMIGALSENQMIYPLLSQLPIDKLCSKPGFLFIWASTQKISELSRLFNDGDNNWTKKFRRSEELIFIPIDQNSPYYPHDGVIEKEEVLKKMQWHCWMCITGTVRRSTDKNLIHCNVNTDIVIENSETINACVPSQIYQVAENFSSSKKRLHIIPSKTGLDHPVRMRPGWVIMSPDSILDNFSATKYKSDIARMGSNIPYNEEIEMLRPKSRSGDNS